MHSTDSDSSIQLKIYVSESLLGYITSANRPASQSRHSNNLLNESAPHLNEWLIQSDCFTVTVFMARNGLQPSAQYLYFLHSSKGVKTCVCFVVVGKAAKQQVRSERESKWKKKKNGKHTQKYVNNRRKLPLNIIHFIKPQNCITKSGKKCDVKTLWTKAKVTE